MLPLLAALALSAPVPKDDAPKPDAITDRHARLLRDNRVQRELGLSAEKRVALIDFFETHDEENSLFAWSLYPPSGPGFESKELTEAKRKSRAEFDTKQRGRMQAVASGCLTVSQFARLRQLERRYLSVFAFELLDVATELKLTAGQQQVAKKAAAECREKYADEYDARRKPSGLPPHELAKPFAKQVTDTFSEAQAARWKELLGHEPAVAPVGIGMPRAILQNVAQSTAPGDR